MADRVTLIDAVDLPNALRIVDCLVSAGRPARPSRSSAIRMSRCRALFIRGVAPLLALLVSGAPLHASEEVPYIDFSDRPKFSEAEAEAETIIREAARKLCAAKRGGGGSRWGYKAFGAVRESCGPERKPPPPLSSDGRFELWSGCQPMDFFVNVDGDAEKIGLTSESLKAAVESRLRAARLYATESSDSDFHSLLRRGVLYDVMPPRSLHVDVHVLGPAFSSTLRFGKWLHDPASGTRGLADTWVDRVLGTHGRDGTSVLRTVSELLDRFIARYLRVNESSCQ